MFRNACIFWASGWSTMRCSEIKERTEGAMHKGEGKMSSVSPDNVTPTVRLTQWVSQNWLRLGGYLISGSLANRLWDRDVHAGSWLGRALEDQHLWRSEDSRNKQRMELNFYAEIWSWVGFPELSCLKVRGLGCYNPIRKSLDIGCTSLLQMVCDLGWGPFLERDSADTIILQKLPAAGEWVSQSWRGNLGSVPQNPLKTIIQRPLHHLDILSLYNKFLGQFLQDFDWSVFLGKFTRGRLVGRTKILLLELISRHNWYSFAPFSAHSRFPSSLD